MINMRDECYMDFTNIDWADSNLERIEIEYDKAILLICNDTLQQKFRIKCTGLAGITNLCIWDDMDIVSAEIKPVVNDDNDFLANLYSAYDNNYNYGGRSLKDGLFALNVELTNSICFSVYCLNIDLEMAV